ncbi:MAG: aldo/keto reductase [Alphaproteobacteria bacterium]|nr:aldo/keto reductase [Alphaproteobacteria bacterium]
MRQITLPSGRATSQLGLGCGPLHGGLLAGASGRLLDAAFEAGIRHFDVAPPYGLGLAEGVVGGHFADRLDEITLATKAGIARPRRPLLMSNVRHLVKPVLGRLPGWSAAAQQVRDTAAPSGNFDPDSVRRSFADSLLRLGADKVDIFLLHEIEAASLTPQLAELLNELLRNGLTDAIGVGTTRDEAVKIATAYPNLAAVQQYRWNVFESPLPADPGGLVITHGAIGPALEEMAARFAADPDAGARWSAAANADLADTRVLADVLLAAALAENRTGLMLFYSHNPDRIRRAVEVSGNAKLIDAGAALSRAIRHEQNFHHA